MHTHIIYTEKRKPEQWETRMIFEAGTIRKSQDDDC